MMNLDQFLSLIGIGILVILAFWFLKRGLVGRILEKGRFCARCFYDLRSLGDSTRCPECGADLADAGAIRAQRMHFNPRAFLIGLLLFAGGAFWFVKLWPTMSWTITWRSMEPTWLLERDLFQVNGTHTDSAAREVIRRVNLRILTDTQYDEVFTKCMKMQRDSDSSLWQPEYGEVMDAIMDVPFLDFNNKTRKEITRNIIHTRLDVLGLDQAGRQLTCTVSVSLPIRMLPSTMSIAHGMVVAEATIDGRSIKVNHAPATLQHVSPTSTVSTLMVHKFSVDLPSDIQPGEHVIAVHVLEVIMPSTGIQSQLYASGQYLMVNRNSKDPVLDYLSSILDKARIKSGDSDTALEKNSSRTVMMQDSFGNQMEIEPWTTELTVHFRMDANEAIKISDRSSHH